MGTKERLRRERIMQGLEVPYAWKIVNTNALYYIEEMRRLYGDAHVNELLRYQIVAKTPMDREGC